MSSGEALGEALARPSAQDVVDAVCVGRADLYVLLAAARQLYETPLLTSGEHERLGRAIAAIRAELRGDLAAPFSRLPGPPA